MPFCIWRFKKHFLNSLFVCFKFFFQRSSKKKLDTKNKIVGSGHLTLKEMSVFFFCVDQCCFFVLFFQLPWEFFPFVTSSRFFFLKNPEKVYWGFPFFFSFKVSAFTSKCFANVPSVALTKKAFCSSSMKMIFILF